MTADITEELVMFYLYSAEEEECHREDALGYYCVPAKKVADHAAYYTNLQPAFLRLLSEDIAEIRANDLYNLSVEDVLDPGREKEQLTADFEKLGSGWRRKKCKVRVDSRLTLLGGTAIWHPQLVGSLIPKFIQDIQNKADAEDT